MIRDRLSDQFFSSADDEIDTEDYWEEHLGKRNRVNSSDRRSKKKIKKFHKDG